MRIITTMSIQNHNRSSKITLLYVILMYLFCINVYFFDWLRIHPVMEVVEWVLLGISFVILMMDLMKNSFRIKWLKDFVLFVVTAFVAKQNLFPNIFLNEEFKLLIGICLVCLIVFSMLGGLVYEKMGGAIRDSATRKAQRKQISKEYNILNWGSALGVVFMIFVVYLGSKTFTNNIFLDDELLASSIAFPLLLMLGIVFFVREKAVQYIFPFLIFLLLLAIPYVVRYFEMESIWLIDLVAFHFAFLFLVWVFLNNNLSPSRYFERYRRLT